MVDAANSTRALYQSAGMSTRKFDGDAELRKIAQSGRDWIFNHGRIEDMESEFTFACLCLPMT